MSEPYSPQSGAPPWGSIPGHPGPTGPAPIDPTRMGPQYVTRTLGGPSPASYPPMPYPTYPAQYPPPTQNLPQSAYYQAPMVYVAPTNGLAVGGFVCSLLGLLSLWFPVVAGPALLVGFILSMVGLSRSSAMGGSGKGLAIAGIVLSLVAVIPLILILIVGMAILMPGF